MSKGKVIEEVVNKMMEVVRKIGEAWFWIKMEEFENAWAMLSFASEALIEVKEMVALISAGGYDLAAKRFKIKDTGGEEDETCEDQI